MTRDSGERIRLGTAEWLTVLAILGGTAAWAQRTHSRLTAIETAVAAEFPRMGRALDAITGKLDAVIRVEQRLHDVDRRVARLEESRHE
jgi:hypothetical protein